MEKKHPQLSVLTTPVSLIPEDASSYSVNRNELNHLYSTFHMTLSLKLIVQIRLHEVYFRKLAARSFTTEFSVKRLRGVFAKSTLGSIMDRLRKEERQQ